MVKIYNNVGQAYVKGYGRVPVRYYGDGYGEVAYTSAKHLGKYAFPVLKKVWGSLNPDAKDALVQAGIDVGMRGSERVGSFVRGQAEALGEKARQKLEGILGHTEESKRISKSAEKMIKKMAKDTRKDFKKKMKKKKVVTKLPKSVQKHLSKSQQKKLNEASVSMLSKMLSGQGLKLM